MTDKHLMRYCRNPLRLENVTKEQFKLLKNGIDEGKVDISTSEPAIKIELGYNPKTRQLRFFTGMGNSLDYADSDCNDFNGFISEVEGMYKECLDYLKEHRNYLEERKKITKTWIFK